MKEVFKGDYHEGDLKIATAEDAVRILDFYYSFIGTEGCTWSEDYPTLDIVQRDITDGNLYYIEDEKGIISAISIDNDPIVDSYDIWTIKNARESARLGVRKDMQNCGIARFMLTSIMYIMAKRGYDGVHFLVSQTNDAALASYAKLGFTNLGKIDLYGEHWYCYEKSIAAFKKDRNS